jgi:hypothetical protein
MTTADRVHQAAAKIRKAANKTSEGDWFDSTELGGWLDEGGDAEYVALMSPPVALAVAEWLDATAADKTAGLGTIHPRAIDLTNLILGDTA